MPLPDATPPAGASHRPVGAAFEWLAWELVRSSPAAQHAISVVLHAFVALVLVELLTALRVDARVSAGAGLLFAVHPLGCAAVATLGPRGAVLGALVLLYGSLRAHRATSARAASAWCAFAVAMSALSHEALLLASVPLTLAIATRSVDARTRRGAIAGVASPGVLAAIVSGGTTSLVAAGRVGAAIAAHALSVVVVVPSASSRYTPAEVSPAIAALVLVAAAVVVAVVVRRRPVVAGAIAAFVLAAIGLAPAALRRGFASDGDLYVCLLAFAIGGAMLADEAIALAARRRMRNPRPLLALVPFAIAVATMPLTWAHDVAFHDETSMLGALADDRPDDPEGRLAHALLRIAGDEPSGDAYATCAAYAEAHPTSTRAHLCVGEGRLAAGDPVGALPFLRTFAEEHAYEPEARSALVQALLATGALSEARALVVRWRGAYGPAPDIEAARAEIERRGPR